MNPNFWSLEYLGEEKSFADWGIAPDCTRQLQSSAADTFTFRIDGLAIDDTLPFAVTETCIIKRNGVRYFYGRVTKTSLTGSPGSETVNYLLEGPWWYLDHLVYQQEWVVSSDYLVGGDLVKEHKPRSILFQDLTITEVDGLVTSVVESQISVQEQIQRILAYAIDEKSAPIQLGTFSIAEVKPSYSEVRDATCGELIRMCLRWVPDCVLWFNYATDPPSINIVRRTEITSASVPFDGDPTSGITVTPRNDLQVAGVRLIYETTNNVNGASWIVSVVDQAGSPDNFQGVIWTVQLSGYSITIQYQKLTISAIDISARPFWESVLPWLKQATAVTIENVRLNNSLVLGQTADASDTASGYDAIAAKDITNVTQTYATDPTAIQNLLTTGQVPHWLADTFSDVTVASKISYTLEDLDTNAKEVKVKAPFTHKVKLTTEDATAGEQQLSHVSNVTPGEAVPTGVAAAYFASAGILHYEGDYTRTQDEVGGDIGPGSKLNITGGPTAWATMDALVQSVSEQLSTGTTAIHFGPPLHLSTQDFIELQRVQRQRAPSFKIHERQDGQSSGGGGQVVGAQHIPQATAVPSAVPGKEHVVGSKTSFTDAQVITPPITDPVTPVQTGPILRAKFEVAGGKIREILIDAKDLVALAAENDNIPDGFVVKLMEWDVCVEGVSKKAVFLSTEPYDPPDDP